MVHESLETRQFGFIHQVWFPAKQPDKSDYQKGPKREKKHRDSVVAVLLFFPASVLPSPLLEHALKVNGGLLQHILLDVGIDS